MKRHFVEHLEKRALLAQTPLTPVPFEAPGLIQAEHFDLGGAGVAYQDSTVSRIGSSSYRPGESVDMGAFATDQINIGHTRAGEWLEYTIRFTHPGTYHFETRFATNTGGKIHFEIDAIDVTGPITLTRTNAWSNYKTASSKTFDVAGGTHMIRLSLDSSLTNGDIANIDSFKIVGDEIDDGEDDEFSPKPLNWKTAASSPIEREEAQSLVYDGKLYALGGYVKGFKATRRVDAYAPITNKWTRKMDLPYDITHAAVTPDPDGRTFWFLGGFEGSFVQDGHDHSHGPPATKKVYKYDAATDKWTRSKDLPNSHGAGGAGIIDNKLYFFGGADKTRTFDRPETYVLNLAEVDEGWERVADLPNPRNHLGGVAVNGKLYAIGGQRGLEDDSRASDDLHVYDPATNLWTKPAELPERLSHFNAATVLFDRYIITVGGENPHNIGRKDVFAYDTLKDKWAKMTDLPGFRRAGIAGIVGTKLIQSTGYFQTQGQTKTTWIAELAEVFV